MITKIGSCAGNGMADDLDVHVHGVQNGSTVQIEALHESDPVRQISMQNRHISPVYAQHQHPPPNIRVLIAHRDPRMESTVFDLRRDASIKSGSRPVPPVSGPV